MPIVSRRAGYGLRAMRCLAEQAHKRRGTTIAELAQAEELPRKYLERVIRDLVQANLVESKPGPNGGCRLARPADQIAVRDIIRALDGEPRVGHCQEAAEAGREPHCPGCPGVGRCALYELWQTMQVQIDEALGAVTLTDIAERQQRLAGPDEVTYHI